MFKPRVAGSSQLGLDILPEKNLIFNVALFVFVFGSLVMPIVLPGVVVVAFVTYELNGATGSPPQAVLTPKKGGASKVSPLWRAVLQHVHHTFIIDMYYLTPGAFFNQKYGTMLRVGGNATPQMQLGQHCTVFKCNSGRVLVGAPRWRTYMQPGQGLGRSTT